MKNIVSSCWKLSFCASIRSNIASRPAVAASLSAFFPFLLLIIIIIIFIIIIIIFIMIFNYCQQVVIFLLRTNIRITSKTMLISVESVQTLWPKSSWSQSSSNGKAGGYKILTEKDGVFRQLLLSKIQCLIGKVRIWIQVLAVRINFHCQHLKMKEKTLQFMVLQNAWAGIE